MSLDTRPSAAAEPADGDLDAARAAASPPIPTLAPGRTAPSLSRLWRGPTADAPWARPALLVLLASTAVLYLWGLGASGWANSFYSAAAQAGSESWKAFFFGSSDASNSITVDKTPLSLWPMALSIRLFGLSSWSILVPQALMGVASVGLLYATVRRAVASPAAGLLAGLALATTPVAALMFRFNNPDAMLVLLLIGATAATLRAVEASTADDPGWLRGRAVRWIALAGALVGLAFLAKMLQAFLVLPGLGLAYLLVARGGFLQRVRHLAVGLVSMIVAAGWWVAVVALWPAGSRPYIGGSQHNSILELTLGYNGFGRLTGDETGSVGGGGGWGATGVTRLFNSEIGGQIAWLLPAALALLILGLWATRSQPRGSLARAALVAWGGWLAVTGVTFSLMQGIFHSYYTVALAPAIAAVVGVGAVELWRRRDEAWSRVSMAAVAALTSVWAFVLLGRSEGYHPWLRWAVLLAGVGSAIALVAVSRLGRRAALSVAGLAVAASLAGPTAYALTTASTAHTGALPTAGPTITSGFGGGMPGGGGFPGGGFPGGATLGQPPANGQFAGGANVGPTGGTTSGGATQTPGGQASAGGLLDGSTSSSAINALLTEDADRYAWVAAAVGSNSAAGYQLATQDPVMAVGGFNGSDPSPTLAAFKQLVAEGKIHYFIGSGGSGGGSIGGGPGGFGTTGSSGSSSQIASWVEANFSAQTVDGVTLYDLSAGVQ